MFNVGDSTYIFNTLTYKTLEVPIRFDNKLSSLLKNPDSDWGEYNNIKEKLAINGVIVPNDYNEIEYLRSRIEQEINTPYYVLTILPTYTCNFACWYCVQKHKNEFMSSKTVEAVKKHIASYLIENQIKGLEIHWFGGEPLLCFENQVSEISRFALDFCKKNGIKFINNITTNGYLIDENMAKSMNELCFSQFQITIDGPRDIHNLTRNDNGKPSFDCILNNINTILKNLPEAQVFLRYNFTEGNLVQIDTMINEINEFFDISLRKKIMILAVKVWQEDKKKFSDICFDDIYTKFRQNGYSISNQELYNTYVKCDADLIHSRVIFHNGKVDKCNNILPVEAHSVLKDNGTIEDLVDDCVVWEDILSQKPCCDCKFLPVCLGPCLNIKRDLLCKSGCLKCADAENHWSIKERIKNYCLIKSKGNERQDI
jgi:uncharacterized protein